MRFDPRSSLAGHIRVSLVAAALLAAACSPDVPDPSSDSTWVGTITTEGVVTTVVNASGSLWGGTSSLVEELSIGVEAGDEPYLFGAVAGVGIAGDRMYVLDAQVLKVRVYGGTGVHVMDFGGEGDGPGEFRRPTGLAVGLDRVYVRDPQTGRISVFSHEGELLETWPTRPLFTSIPIVATIAGVGELLVPDRGAMVPWGPEGPAGPGVEFPAFDSRPLMVTVRITEAIPGYSAGTVIGGPVPFWPSPAFAMSPTGAIIYGEADRYAFVIEQRDGSMIQVESSLEPVPIGAEEANWHRSRLVDRIRQVDPAWQWDGPEVPTTKPAYNQFVPALSGEVWVVRMGPGYEDFDCDPTSAMDEAPERCWKDSRIVDVFDADGRFSGAVDIPGELRFVPRPFIRDETVVGVVQDETGTIMVKRYRLVLPGEGKR
jgi:hypothetical protein